MARTRALDWLSTIRGESVGELTRVPGSSETLHKYRLQLSIGANPGRLKDF